ncbi:MAG: hypothetical protein MRJ96_06830 [Nitrospirales bacterium]|nr:hypothetical protein [Nitrospira sp.]MDR4501148.1 hypothetical protein [Nitrospirales bacterium]
MISTHFPDHLWSIVLAGGAGGRTDHLIEQRIRDPLPAQYCTFTGTRSMLQHTWDRARQVTSPAQQITVVASQHRRQAFAQAGHKDTGKILPQPLNCDTAVGMFLPLTYIRAQNPHATVVVFPSDHFVFPEERFIQTVQQAVQATRLLEDRIILVGVPPTSLELDYGWIEIGGPLGWSSGLCIRRVHGFFEKPQILKGLHALSNRALWNTGILAAKAETLWRLGWKCLPEVMEQFQRLERVIGTSEEERVLESIYHEMPKKNLSSDLLAHIPESMGVIELKDVLWSDWGKSERVTEILQALGKEPVFSYELTQAPDPVEAMA